MLEVGLSFKFPSSFLPVQPPKLCGLVKYITFLSCIQWGRFCKVGKEFLADEVVTFKCSLGTKCTESPWENNMEKNVIFNSRCDRHSSNSAFHWRAVWVWLWAAGSMKLCFGIVAWMLLFSNRSTLVLTLTHKPACQRLQSSLRCSFPGSHLRLHNLYVWHLHFMRNPPHNSSIPPFWKVPPHIMEWEYTPPESTLSSLHSSPWWEHSAG